MVPPPVGVGLSATLQPEGTVPTSPLPLTRMQSAPDQHFNASIKVSRRRKKPLLPVLGSAKAFDVVADHGNASTAEVRNYFALSCRSYNPHETDFHMQARLGFRRQKPVVHIRLRPLAEGDEEAGSIRKELKWNLTGKRMDRLMELPPRITGTPDQALSRPITALAPEAEVDDEVIATETAHKVCTDALR
eukprot:TRINITY_DN27146_c0_g1_i1.p1 TRINITY_DN27146_c0_g1~~TRINITY_DN27146_c0_g1_i1.p1  ORF type:complete len:190 (-),score=40.49 TRINITY_DN27146_c0_g1_i1:52-621(-)